MFNDPLRLSKRDSATGIAIPLVKIPPNQFPDHVGLGQRGGVLLSAKTVNGLQDHRIHQ